MPGSIVKIRDAALSSPAKAAAIQAKRQSGDLQHAGEVYYKNGVVRESNRYITTGRIVVRFAHATQIDLEAFASRHGLLLEKRMGKKGSMAIFVNTSPQNDISQSNALLKEQAVVFSQPDWVLPLKLY